MALFFYVYTPDEKDTPYNGNSRTRHRMLR